MIEIFILSLVQGITEFIPVSSSSHLIIISEYLEFNNQNLEIDVSLHIGSFIAVIVFFRKDIFNFIQNKDLFLKIVVGSIPVMIVGYILVKFNLIDQVRNIKVIGWTTLLFGILLFISDKCKVQKKIESNFTIKSAILIGLFQIISLIPGVSRAGITITGARILNFSRYDAAKISFLLSIPTLAAVSFFGLNNLMKSNNFEFSLLMILAVLLSFFFSLITINFFLKFIKNFSLNIFVIYRVILGTVILLISYL
ncbi:undecaprenyl-diphosphate phosphatase [Pelagibacteraceae bacterium]|nr:undecaprenyl-diphosphate phosphatase [Pelagibacteraceae bacterium]